MTLRVLKHRISQIYYTHGLFCASHPYSILIIVCMAILVTCYPLVNLPLPGNAPLEFNTPISEYSIPSRVYTAPTKNSSTGEQKRPRWYVGPPVGYIQQIVVKSAVSPWQQQQLIPTDAFRAPISKVFDVLQFIENFQYHSRTGVQTIEDVCLRVSEPVASSHVKNLLPQYSCFTLSPANLWSGETKRFTNDPEILKTVYGKYGQAMETPPTLKDLVFGVPWADTGVTRYFIRNKQRAISYAVTIVLQKYDKAFIDALRQKLEAAFPETLLNVNNTEINSLVHVHYKNFNYIVEYTPLLVTYFVLLLYIYFSVRKIEMVKSQFGLAISAVVTVVSSLVMSLSLCFFFGLNPTLNGSEIFPYLVMIIGLENVLVITKSVVSTPVHLDVKIRVAQGLSKEGWYITKNLCTELFIIFIGFFTFVPAIQEFCLFALVGLWTDFFLQMFFFATILSVDIRRMELADLHRQSVQTPVLPEDESASQETEPILPLIKCPYVALTSTKPPPPTSPPPDTPSPSPAPTPSPGPSGDDWQPTPKIYRSKSAPRLDVAFGQTMRPPPSPQPQDDFFQKMPRRLKFFYFWANTRMFQRLIMVCTVIWIMLILYKTGLVEQLANLEDTSLSPHSGPHPHHSWNDQSMSERSLERGEEDGIPMTGLGMGWGRSGTEEPLEVGPVEHTQLETWRGLSHKHWPRVMALYNISLLGRYISILPSIHLSIKIDPQVAKKMRHPSESQGYVAPSQPYPTGTGDGRPHTPTEDKQNVWSHVGGTPESLYYMYDPKQLKAFYPKSRREFFITVCLCVLSVIVISYFMSVLYKCMCSRNYSRWRHSWARHYARRQRAKGAYYKQIKESVPLLLKGHNQEVECVAVDGQFVVSCCYGGQLRMWDSNTGECISVMQRHSITPPRRRKPCLGRNIEDSDADLYAEYHGGKMTPESTSSSEGSLIERTKAFERRIERNRQAMERYSEFTPDLASTINTDFASMEPQPDSVGSEGFDFQQWFEGVYEEHRDMLRESSSQLRERRVQSANDGNLLSPPDDDMRSRSWSQGDSPFAGDDPEVDPASPIWCLTVKDGLIVAGCGNGRIEMWEGESGRLKCQYNISTAGVVAICFVGRRVIAARVDGSIDFLDLETFHNPSLLPPPTTQSSRVQRGHSRQYSAGNVRQMRLWEDTIRCNCFASIRAHQRPINCIQCEGDRLVSASQDHTLKVFRLEDCICLYTFYGHEGSVTALCLDKCPPYAAASGSADGSVRMWDLVTGTCTHKFQWHEEAVVQLATSLQFVVSLGLDDLVCVWERTRCQLLHKLSVELLGGSIILMSQNLGVLGAQGKLELWDLSRGEMVRQVSLQDGDQAFVTHILSLGSNSLVCAAGADLRVIAFPTTLEKAE